MTSQPGQQDYLNQGIPGSSAAAGAFLAQQEAEKKAAAEEQAAADSSAQPEEKKDDSEAVKEKKEDLSTEEPAPPAPAATAAPTTTEAISAAPAPEVASSSEPSEKKEIPDAETDKKAEASAPESSGPAWPETPADHPLTQFVDALPKLLEEAAYDEVYGITLSPSAPFHTKLILQKFLRANANDLTKAKSQLLDTLKWRKSFEPAKAVHETYGKEFEGLGWILELSDVPDSTNETDVVTFNVYGAIKNNKDTFGDIEKFLRWRVALMERSVEKLNLANATKPIPDFGQGPDPYQGIQIHDYLNISFLRMDPDIKAASKRTIEVLGRHYPETLSRKFFVNVPVVMGWIFAARKMVVAPETARKFHMLSYGNTLVNELGPSIPKVYGGTKGDLAEVGEGLKVDAGAE